jgi:hypothetical protein
MRASTRAGCRLHPLWLNGMIGMLVTGVAAGCGSARDRPCDAWGTVTFAGASVSDGAIYFVAPDSKAVLGFAKISGGRYQARVRPGPARVRITGDRLVPGQTNEAGNPLIEQYIPERFNEATELEARIDRSQRLDWRLPGDG